MTSAKVLKDQLLQLTLAIVRTSVTQMNRLKDNMYVSYPSGSNHLLYDQKENSASLTH